MDITSAIQILVSGWGASPPGQEGAAKPLRLHPADARDPAKVELSRAVTEFRELWGRKSVSLESPEMIYGLGRVLSLYRRVRDQRLVNPIFTPWLLSMAEMPAIQYRPAVCELMAEQARAAASRQTLELNDQGVKFEFKVLVWLELESGAIAVQPSLSNGRMVFPTPTKYYPCTCSMEEALVTFEFHASFLDYQISKMDKHFDAVRLAFVRETLPQHYRNVGR